MGLGFAMKSFALPITVSIAGKWFMFVLRWVVTPRQNVTLKEEEVEKVQHNHKFKIEVFLFVFANYYIYFNTFIPLSLSLISILLKSKKFLNLKWFLWPKMFLLFQKIFLILLIFSALSALFYLQTKHLPQTFYLKYSLFRYYF